MPQPIRWHHNKVPTAACRLDWKNYQRCKRGAISDSLLALAIGCILLVAAGNIMLRYLPSFVVSMALITAWVVSDRVQSSALEKEKRQATGELLRQIQTQITENILSTLRRSRVLATQIDSSFNIDQDGFESIVENTETDTGLVKIARVELAPNFITKFVYPLEGNEAYINESPLQVPTNDGSLLQIAASTGFILLSSIGVREDRMAEIQVRAELRGVDGDQVVANGLLQLVVQFDLPFVDPTGKFAEGELEFLYQTRAVGESPPDIPALWQAQGNMEPLHYKMKLPPGDFILYARPVTGWSLTPSEAAPHRLRFLGFGLLLFLPVLLANWFTVARVATISRLSRAQKQMKGLLENLPGTAFTYTIPAGNNGPGPDDRISFLNPESCMEIWGVEAEMAEQNSGIIWDLLASEDVAIKLSAALSSSMHTMTPFNEIYPTKTLQGKLKWIHTTAIPARNSDGSVYWSVLVMDNTEAVEREAELEKQRELTFRAQKTEIIGQLTGGVAHDFNNFLAVTLGNLELLQSNPNHPEREDLLESSINSTLRGADLTKNMLAFARRSRLKPEPLQLNNLVHDVRNWIQRTLPATIVVKINLTDDLELVSADRSSTESALLNLILNARDAMDERGNLTIETFTETIDEPGHQNLHADLEAGKYVVLSVADSGSGIADEHLQNIYEPFFSTKETGKGSGLGLSMVMGFMEQSGGTVKVKTEIGTGTVFKLYFPAIDKKQLVNTVLKDVIHVTSSVGRILIAEDEPGVGEMLTRTLEHEGYKVVLTHSGDEALSLFNSDDAFDVLLTDMIMPGQLQGWELARALRARKPELAVILISGYASDAVLLNTELETGSIALSKPVQRAELIATIKQVLSKPKKQVSAGSENTFTVS